MSQGRRNLAVWGCLGLGLLALAAGIGWHRVRLSSWRAELALARDAMDSGRYGRAREHLARLAEHWDNEGEVYWLLGVCESRRGRREEALAAWDKVPPATLFSARAARSRASSLIDLGRYSPAEETLLRALASPGPDGPYELERELARLYRAEGRLDEVRRILRSSWCRSADAAGVLRELWMLDHSAPSVETWRFALDRADNDDDRVWLGRAHHALLIGDFRAAARWLEACLGRRPEDVPAWRARLELALATDDVDGFRAAVAHLPADRFDAAEIQEMRAWLAARRGEAEVEERELTALTRIAPGSARALERLAVLTTRAGKDREADQLRRRKAEVDRTQHRVDLLLREGGVAPDRAELLARLEAELGRTFDAQAWEILAQAGRAHHDPAGGPRPGPEGRSPLPGDLLAKAEALSSRFPIVPGREAPGRCTLGDRLADLRVAASPGGGPIEAIAPEIAPTAAEPTGAAPEFIDDAAASGLRFAFDDGRTPLRLLPESLSGGVGLLDFDGDGWLDVYCIQGGDLRAGEGEPRQAEAPPGDRLFRNRSDGTFRDVTRESGVAAIAWGRGYGQGVTVGDYDNDGHPDLFLTRLRTYSLYRNRGDGTFEDVTARAGLSGTRDMPTSSAFADLDNDGDLDLYVCHYMTWDPQNPPLCRNSRGEPIYCDPRGVAPAPDHAFRNDGGRFVDVTAGAGLAEVDGRGLGVVAADLDGDHRIDLYVANDTTANDLFRNQGGLRFEEVGHESGVAGNAEGGYQAGMGIACGDLDGDGDPDLMVTNFYGEGTTLFRNLGRGLFADDSAASGIGLATRYLLGFGIAMADVDNDGRLEVMAANGHVNGPPPSYRYPMPTRLYGYRSDGRFVDLSRRSGPPWDVPRVGRGLAVGDLDNDGRCDALVVAQDGPLAYFHNRTRGAGHSVTLRLEGTASNRDGVGALVAVTAGGRRQVAQRLGGGSYLSANDPRLHFGLGPSDRVAEVEVRWPSGRTDRWTSLPADTGYSLREGDPTPRPLAGFAGARRPG